LLLGLNDYEIIYDVVNDFVFSRLNFDSEDDNLHSINIHAYFSYNPDCKPKTFKLKDGRNKKVSRSTTEVFAKKLYKETIAISKEKYNDLIKLCTYIWNYSKRVSRGVSANEK
jgi:hypothetical protein